MIKLTNTLIEVTGKDSFKFLQGLVTNDINLLTSNLSNTIYSLILTPKGRYLFDIFIYKINNESFLLEVEEQDANFLLETLKKYTLLSKITFSLKENLNSYYIIPTINNNSYQENIIQDTRTNNLGHKIITEKQLPATDSYQNYLTYLYNQGIPTSTILIKEKTIPIEVGFDELNAICYKKGCYLGQEFTNSAKRKLAIKKRLLQATTSNYNNIQIKDEIINNNQEKIGEIIYINKDTKTILILGLIKFLDSQNLSINNQKITLVKPTHTTHFTLE
jgi:folate-binding protein YgfZ